MMRFLSNLLVFTTSLALMQACALTPGMHMQAEDNITEVEAPVLKNGNLVKEKVKITPITADLLIEREKMRKEQLDALPGDDDHKFSYRIGPHDRLQITVWNHPELNDPGGEKIMPELAGKTVDDNGRLYYPYIGEVEVAGKTVSEVRVLLTQALSKYFKKVKLDVRVLSFQSHRTVVAGEVKNPGVQAMTETPLTIAEAISRAGGVTPDADISNIDLARDGKMYKINVQKLYEKGGVNQNLLLKDGDIVYIPDRKDNKVYVMGEVGKQQALQINRGKMSLTQAIAEAYGVEVGSSNPGDIYVIRPGLTNPEIFQLNAESPDALILGDQFALQPHDTIFVGAAGVTRWSRVINQLLPSSFISTMSTMAIMGGI
jgi:polysaccharide biosynthesis/export protein